MMRRRRAGYGPFSFSETVMADTKSRNGLIVAACDYPIS
jgi:hypothetical protein